MFVDITTPQKPLAAERLFRDCYRGDKQITLAICWDVLKSTNFATCIERMLKCIEALPFDEQAKFEEVVLSVFTNREQPQTVLEAAQRLAQNHHYTPKLEETRKRILPYTGYVYSTPDSPNASAKFFDEGYYTTDRHHSSLFADSPRVLFHHPDLKMKWFDIMPEYMLFPFCEWVDIEDCNLKNVKNMRFADGATVFLTASQVKSVDVLPEVLDFSNCSRVQVTGYDLSNVKEIKLPPNGSVVFRGCKNFPKNFDASMCYNVTLAESDLTGIEHLTLASGSRAFFSHADNIPPNTDLSRCSYIDLAYCNLAPLKNLTFAPGSRVELDGAINIPPNLDIFPCKNISLGECDLSPLKVLNFSPESEVSLIRAKNFPKLADFTPCRILHLFESNLQGVEKLIFANNEQMHKSGLEKAFNWNGKLGYSKDNAILKSIFTKLTSSFRN